MHVFSISFREVFEEKQIFYLKIQTINKIFQKTDFARSVATNWGKFGQVRLYYY